MPRVVIALLLTCLILTPVGADEERGDQLMRALRVKVSKAVREARPAIACILVSRSEAYYSAPFWGIKPDPEQQGVLGRFDREAAEKLVPSSAPHRSRILRTIAQHDLSDPTNVPESYGSGIVIDRSGLILTNAHIVREATKIYVRLPDRRSSWADIVACDPRSDLAILKLLDPPLDLQALPLGEGEKIRPGDFVIHLANPYMPGFRSDAEPASGYGLVSQLRRKVPGGENELERHRAATLHHYGTLMQTDAQSTPGCSGGVLLDLQGKAVGLTTALAGLRGDRPGAFAIPLDANTRRIIEVLKRGEEVEYGFLGVQLQSGVGGGVHVMRVTPGTPAARGNIRAGDKIISVNGNPINDIDDLFLFVGMSLAGSEAVVEVSRNFGGPRSCNVTLAKFYVPGSVIASKRPPARFGLRVDYTSIKLQRDPFLNFNRSVPEGVVIREVIPNSPADEALLQPDKIITHVNGRLVTTPKQYYEQIMLSPGKKVELTVLNSENRFVQVTLEEK